MTEDQASPKLQLDGAAAFLLSRTTRRPSIGVILGSGLGTVADLVGDAEVIPFSEVPHLPMPTVPGHGGMLVLGTLAGRSIAVMRGRLHYFEGLSMWQVTFPVRLLQAIGVSNLILTNAAGGLNPDYGEGDLMAIDDHICVPSLAGINPLRGLNPDAFGPRFVSMQQPYDRQLIATAMSEARREDIQMHRGVYAMVGGPTYETAAELALLRNAGADAVGMSTAPEAIVAAQLGVRVLGISCITNHVLATGDTVVSHEDVLAHSRAAAPRIAHLVRQIVGALPPDGAK